MAIGIESLRKAIAAVTSVTRLIAVTAANAKPRISSAGRNRPDIVDKYGH
jgi:hypothetical protein